MFLSQRIYILSPHPRQVQNEITVELPETRNLEMKLSKTFIDIKRQVLQSLRGE